MNYVRDPPDCWSNRIRKRNHFVDAIQIHHSQSHSRERTHTFHRHMDFALNM
jgi:hypothetical protein